jgi:hypothetical protein
MNNSLVGAMQSLGEGGSFHLSDGALVFNIQLPPAMTGEGTAPATLHPSGSFTSPLGLGPRKESGLRSPLSPGLATSNSNHFLTLPLSREQSEQAYGSLNLMRQQRKESAVLQMLQQVSQQVRDDMYSLLLQTPDLLLELCEKERGHVVVQLMEQRGPGNSIELGSAVIELGPRLVINQNGCIAFARVYDVLAEEQQRVMANYVLSQFQYLATHPYGNYAVQRVLKGNFPADMVCVQEKITDHLPDSAIDLSGNKFGSHVLESFLVNCDPEIFKVTMRRLLQDNTLLPHMCNNRFANYVLQSAMRRVTQFGDNAMKDEFVAYIKPHLYGCQFAQNIVKSWSTSDGKGGPQSGSLQGGEGEGHHGRGHGPSSHHNGRGEGGRGSANGGFGPNQGGSGFNYGQRDNRGHASSHHSNHNQHGHGHQSHGPSNHGSHQNSQGGSYSQGWTAANGGSSHGGGFTVQTQSHSKGGSGLSSGLTGFTAYPPSHQQSSANQQQGFGSSHGSNGFPSAGTGAPLSLQPYPPGPGANPAYSHGSAHQGGQYTAGGFTAQQQQFTAAQSTNGVWDPYQTYTHQTSVNVGGSSNSGATGWSVSPSGHGNGHGAQFTVSSQAVGNSNTHGGWQVQTPPPQGTPTSAGNVFTMQQAFMQPQASNQYGNGSTGTQFTAQQYVHTSGGGSAASQGASQPFMQWSAGPGGAETTWVNSGSTQSPSRGQQQQASTFTASSWGVGHY